MAVAAAAVVFLLGVLVPAVTYYGLFFSEQRADLRAESERQIRLEKDLGGQEEGMAVASEIVKENGAVVLKLKKMSGGLVEAGKDLESILGENAESAGVRLDGVKALSQIKHASVEELSYEVKFSGSDQKGLDFLERVEDGRLMTKLSKLTLTPNDGGYEFSCVVSWFRALEAP